jgi:hypothetical protein
MSSFLCCTVMVEQRIIDKHERRFLIRTRRVECGNVRLTVDAVMLPEQNTQCAIRLAFVYCRFGECWSLRVRVVVTVKRIGIT